MKLSAACVLFFALSSFWNSFAEDLSAEDYFKRANTERQSGDLKSASADYDCAIGLADNNGEFHLFRGACYFEQRQWDQAIADFRKAEALQPVSQRRARLFIWAARTLKGEAKEARVELKRIVTDEMARAARKSSTPFPPGASGGLDKAAATFENGPPRKHLMARQTEQEWLVTIEKFLVGKIKESTFFSLDPPPHYRDSRAQLPYRPANTQSCEALFYAALKQLAGGDRRVAADYLTRCAAADGPADSLEREFARSELEALQIWPHKS